MEGWEKKGRDGGKGKREKSERQRVSLVLSCRGRQHVQRRSPPTSALEKREGREENEAPMLRCSGCDLNRACKSPFSRTQHARSSSSHKHQQLSTVERGRLVWTGYVPVDVVVPKKVRSKRETTSDGPPHPTIHPTIPRPPTSHSHSSPMPRDSWWVPSFGEQ